AAGGGREEGCARALLAAGPGEVARGLAAWAVGRPARRLEAPDRFVPGCLVVAVRPLRRRYPGERGGHARPQGQRALDARAARGSLPTLGGKPGGHTDRVSDHEPPPRRRG